MMKASSSPERQASRADTEDSNEESDDPIRLHGAKVQHRCTDIPWCIVALICCAQVVSVRLYSVRNMSPDLIRGYNEDKHFCGGKQGNLSNKPFLFWCVVPPANVTAYLTMPICVSQCPRNISSNADICPWGLYPTKELLGGWCKPTAGLQRRMVAHLLGNGTSSTALKLYTDARTSWSWVVGLNAVLAVVLGLVYLLLLRCCLFRFVVPLCQVGLLVSSLGTSYYFYTLASPGGLFSNPDTGKTAAPDSDKLEQYFYECCCVAFFVWFMFLLCLSISIVHDQEGALACIQASIACIMAEKTLLLEPIIASIIRMCVCVWNVLGFALLLGTGEVTPTGHAGIGREITYSSCQKYYIVVCIMWFLWCLEMVGSISTYAVAWATMAWYNRAATLSAVHRDSQDGNVERYNPRCVIVRGYWHALRYHLGSLAIGSFLMVFLRPLIWVTELIATWPLHADGKDVQKHCACCTGLFNQYLAQLTPRVYMQMAMKSEDWSQAAPRAYEVAKDVASRPDFAALRHEQQILRLAGQWLITYACAYGTLLCAVRPPFNDVHSLYFVESPMRISVVAAMVGFLLSTCFMNVMDSVVATIVYRISWETQELHARKQSEKTGADYDSTLDNLWSFLANETSESDADLFAPDVVADLLRHHAHHPAGHTLALQERGARQGPRQVVDSTPR